MLLMQGGLQGNTGRWFHKQTSGQVYQQQEAKKSEEDF